MSTDIKLSVDQAKELVRNKIVEYESKLSALKKAEIFLKELSIDEMAIDRIQAAETITAILTGGYFR